VQLLSIIALKVDGPPIILMNSEYTIAISFMIGSENCIKGALRSIPEADEGRHILSGEQYCLRAEQRAQEIGQHVSAEREGKVE
jgi:hypothetical protein